MNQTLRIAGVQMDVTLGDVPKNLARIEAATREAARAGATVVVFPECAVSGYCFDSLDEAREFSQPLPGPATKQLANVCRELDVHVVVGMLEREGERLFNAAALVGPAGLVGSYRKAHLPFLGIDRFVTPGDTGFGVFAAGAVRVGLHICYDVAFPEAARTMALDGADLLALPTNWPPGSECAAAHVIPTRAMENHVYVAAVNRVGEERGFTFIGQSKICAPGGRIVAAADHTREEILYAEVDPAVARNKHLVRVPGKHEINRFADRRPELYGRVIAPK